MTTAVADSSAPATPDHSLGPIYEAISPGREQTPGSAPWNARRNAIATTGANLLISVVGILSGVMAARLLGPKGRGELAAIQAWPTALAVLALLGTPEAVLYFCARDPRRRSEYLSAALVIASVGALAFSAVGFWAMPWLLASQNSRVVYGARIFLVQIWMYLLIAMPNEALRGNGSFAAWNLVRIIPMLLWAGIFAAAWIVGARKPVSLACAYTVVGWVVLGPEVLALRGNGFRLRVPRGTELRSMLRFGLPAAGTFMPRMLNLRLDQILMAGLMPPVALGQYVVAVAWSNAGAPLMHGVSAVIVPKLAPNAVGGVAGRGAGLAQATRIGVLLAALAAAGLLCLAAEGIRLLFGTRFSAAVPVARLLAIAGAVAGLNMMLSEGVRALGRPGAALRAELAALIVTVAGLWLLLRPMGIYGAALVSLLAYTVTACWLLGEVRFATGIAVSEFLIPRRGDLTLLLTAGSDLMAAMLAGAVTVHGTIIRVLKAA
jgi:O-antigen/teichoic acid export membrane protein